MNKYDKEYIAIFDEYLEKVPDKEGYYYISDNTLLHFIYKMTSLERQKSHAENSLLKVKEKTEYYQYIAHIYKIELGRCVRKLTRIYDEIRKYAMLNYIFNIDSIKPEEVVKIFKEI